MRQYAQKGFRIEQLSTDAKLLYTGFLVLSMAGLVLAVVYYGQLINWQPLDGEKAYYAGELPGDATAEPLLAAELADADGPAIELPDDALMSPTEPIGGPLIAPMTGRKLMEVTHFHLFTLPVFLLIIAHVFMLCAMRPRLKTAMILSAVLSVATHVAAPWILFTCGGAWAWLMPATGAWMMSSLLAMIGWSTWSMWRNPRAARGRTPASANRARSDLAHAQTSEPPH